MYAFYFNRSKETSSQATFFNNQLQSSLYFYYQDSLIIEHNVITGQIIIIRITYIAMVVKINLIIEKTKYMPTFKSWN
jgi:hypothetical protein